MNTGQVSCNDTSSLLLNTQPGVITFRNQGANTVFIGPSGVTTANGFPLAINESVEFDTRNKDAVVHAVCASAETATVAYIVR